MTMVSLCIDRLIDRINELGNPTVVGLDPQMAFIPTYLFSFNDVKGNYPKFLNESSAILRFNRKIIDEIANFVPAVKLQVAMYERYGVLGLKTYYLTVKYAKNNGLIVIGDIKRGDIDSTAKAYAEGHLGSIVNGWNTEEIYDADFVTLNPYMGFDAVSPFLDVCKVSGQGVFVLVKTSNPSSADIQDVTTAGGAPVYEHVGKLVSKWGKPYIGKHGYSSVGAVVGATYPEQGKALRALMPHTFFLVPGYGAQGGSADDVKPMFDANGGGAIVNSSRGIIAAWQSEKYRCDPKDFAKAARQAALDMKKALTE